LYTDDVDPLQIHVNSAFDWESPKYTPKFSEGYVDFKEVQFQHFKHVVIDFRRIQWVKKRKGKGKEVRIDDFGWTI
jgi:hypothetical protein